MLRESTEVEVRGERKSTEKKKREVKEEELR